MCQEKESLEEQPSLAEGAAELQGILTNTAFIFAGSALEILQTRLALKNTAEAKSKMAEVKTK